MKNLIYIICLLFFVSCSNEKKPINIPKITLKLLDTPKVFIEDIAQDIVNVDLGAPKDTALRLPSHFFITDSLIVVGDRLRNSIIIFDRKGKVKNRFQYRGDKKNGVSMMTDVIFDAQSNQMEIFDKFLSKISVVNMDGRTTQVIDVLNRENFGLSFVKSGNLYVSPPHRNVKNRVIKSRLSTFEKTGNILSFHGSALQALPILKNLDIAFPHQLENYKDSIYYLPLLHDTIYNVKLDEAVPAYEIVAPVIPDKLKQENAKDHFEYLKKMAAANVIYNVNSLFITDKWITFRYNYQSPKLLREVFYSKKTGKTIQFTGLRSRKDSTFRTSGHIVAKYNDYFVMEIPHVKKYYKPFLATGKPVQIKTMPTDVSFSLVFFKMKDF